MAKLLTTILSVVSNNNADGNVWSILRFAQMRISTQVFSLLVLLHFSSAAGRRPWTMSKEKYPDVKPIAVVFPQYHPIPENDRLWGANFTEWTMLKPIPRVVNGIIIRRPHEDIGYYNILDFEHRRYMRAMADHFGIYGFNFYHYWFKDRPVMYRPVQQMLVDGEPNKPFMFTWANEPWSRRWDGNRDNILIDQEYGEERDNVHHFNYLLPFFEHRNYIKIDGMPVFVFYRIDHADANAISAIIMLWQRLAIENGLPGVCFMRFFGPFDNTVRVPGLRGLIQFEPVLSWVPRGGGPSIFPDGKFDKQIFLKNNPDIAAKGLRSMLPYISDRRRDKLFRTSQFKVYDKKKTWQVIERKSFHGYENVIRGTFVNWNNSPRRNFTNGQYHNYPHMVFPASVSGFQRHLQGILKIVNEENALGMKLFQLTAWNEWNEQSVFEPNDIDGYDALQAIKNVARAHTGRTIVHISQKSGSTLRYVNDLSSLFGHYQHVFSHNELEGASYPPPYSNCSLLHIHSFMKDLQWGVLTYAKSYVAAGVPVFLTIHDYQYLFPVGFSPSLEYLLVKTPSATDVDNTRQLFSLAQRIIFPSTFIKQYYLDILAKGNSSVEQYDHITLSAVVTPHCDMLPSHDYLELPVLDQNIINIAFIGYFSVSRGSDLFIETSEFLKNVSTFAGETFVLKYHVFGNLYPKYKSKTYSDVAFHGQFKGDRNLRLLMTRQRIHILLLPSLYPETFGYSATLGINMGVAVAYLNRGSLMERLGPDISDKYFPAETPRDIVAAIRQAALFVIHTNSTNRNKRCCKRSLQTQPTKWYIDNYLY